MLIWKALVLLKCMWNVQSAANACGLGCRWKAFWSPTSATSPQDTQSVARGIRKPPTPLASIFSESKATARDPRSSGTEKLPFYPQISPEALYGLELLHCIVVILSQKALLMEDGNQRYGVVNFCYLHVNNTKMPPRATGAGDWQNILQQDQHKFPPFPSWHSIKPGTKCCLTVILSPTDYSHSCMKAHTLAAKGWLSRHIFPLLNTQSSV